jgi:hypothetical protein
MAPIEAEAKVKAIAGMEYVYRSADKVLIFNASLVLGLYACGSKYTVRKQPVK